MRNLIVVIILCLTSTPAFACVFDTDCKRGGSVCVDVFAKATCLRVTAMTMSPRPRSERVGRPAKTTVIAAQVPVASRAQA